MIDHEILANLGNKSHLPPNFTVYKNVKYIGNTTSSSIPISLKLAMKSKDIKKGDDLLLCGFGVGLSISIVSIKI